MIILETIYVLQGRLYMAVSYDKLWKLLIDKKMNKTQLCEKAKISTNAMARLGKNEDVRVEVLTRICLELGCTMDEIMEIFPEQK
jgi:DNA-binding Xre family transcriptional regulator